MAKTRESFARLYRAHADAVLVFIARRVCDREVAMDLTAETFAQAFVSRKRFRGKTEAEAQAWVYTIARRQIADYFRRGSAERRALDKLGIAVPPLTDDDLERVDQLAGLADLRASVAVALHGLEVDQRDALDLRIVRELPYAEVAHRLGVSEQAARARVSRGLRTLALLIECNPSPTEVAG